VSATDTGKPGAKTEVANLRREVKKLRKRVADLEPFEPRTKGLRVAEDGTVVVDVHFPESFAQLMLANFRWYLDEHDAPNYVQMPMTDMTTGETYVCTIGRPGGQSPHEMRRLAEARVMQLEAELARTREPRPNHHDTVPVELAGDGPG
jgi:hypothetical protein